MQSEFHTARKPKSEQSFYRKLVLVMLCASVATGHAQTYTFSVSGSISTITTGLNDSGAITGFYDDPTETRWYGFVRDRSGTITTFDPSGSTGTIPYSINASGSITGSYNTGQFPSPYGFVRDPSGNITSFYVPSSPISPSGSAGTFPLSINAGGTITGYYIDDGTLFYHGFIAVPPYLPANITPFDLPGSTGDIPYSINASGAITGYYTDASRQPHGFIAVPPYLPANITPFDASGGGTTYPLSINASGTITGEYHPPTDGSHWVGFVRDPSGDITSFDPSGSTWTTPLSINASGAIAGYYSDASNYWHGFVRDPSGNITSTAVYATYPGSINASGAVTGGLDFGFLGFEGTGFSGRVPNGVDISRSVGNVSDAVWQSMIAAGVSVAVVQAWGGGSPSPYAEDQLVGDGETTHGAQGNDLATGAYVLLNYFTQDSAAYQVKQAIQAVGTGKANLKFIAVDIEICCGEFVNWQPSHSYTAYVKGKTPASVIMDSAKHIQKTIVGGKSGSTAPSWNDNGGTTTDGAVIWEDTGKTVIDQAGRIARISAAVSDIEANGLKAIIYTDSGNWKQITGGCDSGNCANLIVLPLWDVEHKVFYGGDGLKHCGDGTAGLYSFKPYSPLSWPSRSANQYDFGLVKPPSPETAPSWNEYELGASPKSPCNGDAFFGLADVDMDYFDPTLFQVGPSAAIR